MRKSQQQVGLLLTAMILCAAMVSAAEQTGITIIGGHPEKIQKHQAYGTAETVTGQFIVSDGTTRLDKAYAFIASREESFKMANPSRELELISEKTDQLGMTHLRFQQTYNDLPVWGCQTIVHFMDDRTIYAVGGQTIPTPNQNTTPSITVETAESSALFSLKAELESINTVTETEMVIYPGDGDPRLAQMVVITSPDRGNIRWRAFVDARTGEILHKFNDIHFDGPDIGTGPDTRDSTRTFNIYETGGEYTMRDVTHSAEIVTYQDYYGGGPISTDPDSDKVWDDATSMKAEVAGHYYTMLSYEYLWNTFGRDSYDDNGSTILVNCHDPLYVNNAYWNGEGINFADGDGVNWLPFSGSLDVVAHELGHGVTEYTAGLIYQYMSGALNESYSDVMGANVDRDDWYLGEEISLTGGFIRSMADPNLAGDPKHMNEYLYLDISIDNGGVHSNSGIPNHAYYLTATQIGRDDAEQIWYRTLTLYLTPGSGFYFWAGMTVQSAIDLFGAGSAQADAVETALAMVGLAGVYTVPEIVTGGGLIGEVGQDELWVYNPASGNGSQTVTVVPPAIPGLTVIGGPYYQEEIPDGDSSQFLVSFDGTALDECDLGGYSDTLVFNTDGFFGQMEVRLPLTVTVGLTTRNKESGSIATSCLSAQAYNTNQLDYLSRDANDVLYLASLMLGINESGNYTVYRDFFGVQRFSPVAEINTNTEKLSYRFSAEDSRLQGIATIIKDTADAGNCDFYLIDYAIFNPCDTPLTILAGFVADFDVDNSGSNIVDRDDSRNMIWMQNGDDTRAAGMALLSGEARNLRGIHNPTWIWSGAFTDQVAYNEMLNTHSSTVPFSDDWTALLTFDNPDIGPGDTLHYVMALMYSNTGSSGMAEIHDRAATFYADMGYLCGDATGDDTVNILDISFLIAYLYSGGPAPNPLDAADVDGNGNINILDISYLINYLYMGGPEPAC